MPSPTAEALEELAAEAALPTLRRQRLRDVADALRTRDEAEAAAVRWAKDRWYRWRRFPWNWPCSIGAAYCPHLPACRNLVNGGPVQERRA